MTHLPDLTGGLLFDELRWTALEGFPGLTVALLSDNLDELTGTGSRTRLVRFDAGALTGDVLRHPYWEEVLCLSGSLHDRAAPDRPLACFIRRPPQMPHGPFISPSGCLLVEFQYFRNAAPLS
jgi:hypothetical protein